MGSIKPADLAACFDAWAAPLALLARSCGAGFHADDLVQDAFLAAMRHRRKIENLKAWLFAAVRNAALNQHRDDRRRLAIDKRLAENTHAWFFQRPDVAMDAQEATAAMELLLPEQREAVVLRIWGQMTLQEIAHITGRPVSTIHGQYEAAMQQLRKRMVKDEQQQR